MPPTTESLTKPDLLMASLADLDFVWKELITLIRPKCILEVGSEAGTLTRALLRNIEDLNTRFTVIDPAPTPSLQDWMEHPKVTFWRRRSLDVLPFFGGHDLVFLDGDHNAFTLEGEIRSLCSTMSKPKLIVFHDTGWPWGERDLYYDPSSIPPEFRHSYTESAGPVPGDGELKDWGYCFPGRFFVGLNDAKIPAGTRAPLEKALRDGPLNGWKHLFIPTIFGISICYNPDALKKEVVGFLERLTSAISILRPHLEGLERNRNDLFLSFLRTLNWGSFYEKKSASLTKALDEKQSLLDDCLQQLAKLTGEFNELIRKSVRYSICERRFFDVWHSTDGGIVKNSPSIFIPGPHGRKLKAIHPPAQESNHKKFGWLDRFSLRKIKIVDLRAVWKFRHEVHQWEDFCSTLFRVLEAGISREKEFLGKFREITILMATPLLEGRGRIPIKKVLSILGDELGDSLEEDQLHDMIADWTRKNIDLQKRAFSESFLESSEKLLFPDWLFDYRSSVVVPSNLDLGKVDSYSNFIRNLEGAPPNEMACLLCRDSLWPALSSFKGKAYYLR